MDKTIRNRLKQAEAKSAFFKVRRLFPHRGRIALFAGDGAGGLSDSAPYDAIIVAAAVRRLEDISALRDQLRDRGRLLFLYGSRISQMLYIVERQNATFITSVLEGVSFSFVPLITRASRGNPVGSSGIHDPF